MSSSTEICTTPLPGVLLIKPVVHADERGFFLETYRHDALREAGIGLDFVQDNHSRSGRGVLRGLHYQMQHTQGKLVRVARGRVFDVAVDVRRGSPHFGQWFGALLDDEQHHQLYVPPGFAHGFLVLSEVADFIYSCTDYYHPQSEQGVLWNDPRIGIDWPVAGIDIRLSDKDRQSPLLSQQQDDRLPAFDDFRT